MNSSCGLRLVTRLWQAFRGGRSTPPHNIVGGCRAPCTSRTSSPNTGPRSASSSSRPRPTRRRRSCSPTSPAPGMLQPSFVSVTYGAGGSTRERTHDLIVRIHRETNLTAVSHLTCVCHTEEELAAILDRYATSGIENILALGGDPPRNLPDYDRSKDAFSLRRRAGSFHQITVAARRSRGFGVGVAGFPEGHPPRPTASKRWTTSSKRWTREPTTFARSCSSTTATSTTSASAATWRESACRSSPGSCRSRRARAW